MKKLSRREQQRLYRILFVAAVGVLAFGTVFYRYIEGWSWVDAYYFCVTTLTTIGYGNFVPQTTFAKIFTTFYIMIGIGILGAFLRAFLGGQGERLVRLHRKHHTDDNHKSN